MATTAAVLTAATLLLIALPDFDGHWVDPAADLVLDTVALVATASAAVLWWLRYSEGHQSIWLYQSAAFLVLAMADAVAVALAVGVGSSQATIGSAAATGQAQWFVWTIARTLAAILLVVGGATSLRGGRADHPTAVVTAPGLLMLAVIALVFASGDVLFPLFTIMLPVSASSGISHLSANLLGSAVLVLGSLSFLWAAGLTRRLRDRDGLVGQSYVAIGLVFAAFAQLQQVLFPSVHPLEVSSGDVLWLAFSVTLLVGIEAQARDTLAALRTANVSLELLRDVEVDRAALEERARLSRELHDGLAQDLWLAKLKAGRLAAMPGHGPEARILCDEVVGAIDTGLADARQAVMALRISLDSPETPMVELLRRYVEDFQDRFGLRVEMECDDTLPRLRPRVEAEILRITQEALSNVAQHADATLVQVQLLLAGDQLTLLVRDNGRGFDLTAVGDDDFGLASMHERAAIIGGELTIEARPSDGTCIKMDLPHTTTIGVGAASW